MMAGLPPTVVSASMRQSKRRADDGAADEAVADAEFSSCVQHGEAGGAAGAAGRAVDLAGADGDGVEAFRDAVGVLDRRGELAEGDVAPIGKRRVAEAELLVRGLGDAHAELRDVARFVGSDAEAERVGVDDDEAVAAIGGVDGDCGQAFDFELRVEPVGEGGDVLRAHLLDAAVAAGGGDLDEAAGRLEDERGFGLGHRQDAGFEQDGGDADGVGAGHGRRVGGLHDDPAHLGARVFRRHEEVDVAEDAAARLVQHEVAERVVGRDEAGLLPDRVARWRRDAADDDVADLAFGMAADDVDDLAATHGCPQTCWLTSAYASV